MKGVSVMRIIYSVTLNGNQQGEVYKLFDDCFKVRFTEGDSPSQVIFTDSKASAMDLLGTLINGGAI